MSPDEIAAVEARRELLLTVSPFDHGKWIQAQSILIQNDVPALLAHVKEQAAEIERLKASVELAKGIIAGLKREIR